MSLTLRGPNADIFRPWSGGTNASLAHFTLNQSTDSITWVWSQPENATMTRVAFRQNNASGTPPTYRFSLQGVAGDGNEDGVIKGGGNCFVDHTPIAANNGNLVWLTLNQNYNATAGEMLALVVAHQSGTIDGTNNVQISVTSAVGEAAVYGVPYVITNDNNSRTRNVSTPVFAVGSSTQVYGLPLRSIVAAGYSSPTERALRFRLPPEIFSSAVVTGIKLYANIPASGSADLHLYTDGGTTLATASYDGDHAQSNAAGRPYVIYFPSPVTITAGQWYRLSLRPTSGSWTLYGIDVQSDDDWDAWGWRGYAHGSERTGSGSWTDQTLRRYGIQPLLSTVTPAGGSMARIIGG